MKSYFNNYLIDFAICTEAENSLPLLISEFEKKTPDYEHIPGLLFRKEGFKKINKPVFNDDLDALTVPDYSFINLALYQRKGYRLNTNKKMNAPIWITRGCPFNCKFCTARYQNGNKIRHHSVEYVINWIYSLYYTHSIRHINIIDDNFTFNISFAKELLRQIKKLGLKDLTFGTPNGIRLENTDQELFKLMKQCGWQNITIAPESGSARILKIMNKKNNLNYMTQKIIEIKKAKLRVHAFFIIGFPGEEKEDLNKTINYIRKNKFDFFFISNFQPFKGTTIYDELLQKGEISDTVRTQDFFSKKPLYITPGLKNVNFNWIRLREYLILILSRPLLFFYILRINNPIFIFKKIISSFLLNRN